MSMLDVDDALLGVDDDELDYDLEKDEEDALLADDNYEDIYDETQGEENQENDQQYEEPLQIEEESDVLDIDSNVHLDETEEDFGEQTIKENPNDTQESVQQEIDDEEEIEEQKERNRFLNERSTTESVSVQRTNTNEIPDTLDKVTVQPVHQPHNHQRNGRFQRGNRGRGRGRQNHNRGSVFGRVGNIPLEGKTVLINPHFRGNVQVSENARLVWDSNFQNNNFPQQRYQGPQMAQVAPFQSQPSPWLNPPYSESNNTFNHPPIQPNYQEPPPSIQYNQQPPEMINTGIRPLMQVSNQPPPFVAQQPPSQQQQQQQGNCRGRDARFSNQPAIPPLMMNNPPPNFNQQQNYQVRNNFNFPENQNIPPNQNRPYISQNNHHAPPPVVPQMQQSYPPQQQNFDQPPPHFIQQNQFNQNRHVQPVYEQYNEHNQFQSPAHNQFPSPMHNQNFPGQNFQQPVSYEPSFIPNQPVQETFPQKQYNHQYNQNQHQRHQMNNYNNRTPPKRRSFENTCSGDLRDLPKKKKRSMELSNLHEVPTVDMPDTTTEEREEEDEDMKAYRLLVEEQKRLREIVIREKEERRKLAAAQQAAAEASANISIPAESLLTTLKTRAVATTSQQHQQPNPIVKQIQTVKQPNQQWRPPQQQQQQQQQQKQLQQQQQQQKQLQQQQQHPQQQQQQKQVQQQQQYPQHGQNLMNRNPQLQQQQRQRQIMQQRKMQNNQQRPQNIQVQTNAAGQRANQGRVLQQRRLQQNQQANIVITQKNEVLQQQQQQRIVMLKQNSAAGKGIPNRRVVLKGMNNIASDSEPSSGQSSQESQDSGTLSSFLSNRKVISNTTVAETSGVVDQPSLLETPLVVVSNLAAGTTDVKIRKLCQGLGPIQNIQMIPNARQATIRFKNIVSAHKFFKKYQRKIVDLSMIQVSLEPIS